MENEKATSATNSGKPVKGIVTARETDSGGHGEIGIVTEEGEFLPLVTGMLVEIAGMGKSEEKANLERFL